MNEICKNYTTKVANPKYHDIDKWASELCGSQHDGESCANCACWQYCTDRFEFSDELNWCSLWENII